MLNMYKRKWIELEIKDGVNMVDIELITCMKQNDLHRCKMFMLEVIIYKGYVEEGSAKGRHVLSGMRNTWLSTC